MMKNIISFAVVSLAVGAGGLWMTRVFPVVTKPAERVTVFGEAKEKVKNQIATFSVGVNITKDKKEDATLEINSKMKSIIDSVKVFGIKDEDIKNQNMNYYQNPDEIRAYGVAKPGMWNVTSNIEIILRDVSKASELTTVLTSGGANSIYGPNFMLDDTNKTELGLIDQAIKNAKEKAEIMAKSSGRGLGRMVGVYENPSGMTGSMSYSGYGGGAPLEVGSGMVYKSVSVEYELK